MHTYLFLGGNQNGQNIPVADDMEFKQLPVGATSRETYIRDTLAVGAYESFTFYRHEKLTSEEVLDLLVKHYKAWCVNPPGGRH
jgi:hypothetical protein